MFVLLYAEQIVVLAIALAAFGITAHAVRRSTGSGVQFSWAGASAAVICLAGVVLSYASAWGWRPDDPNPWRFSIPLLGGAVALLVLVVAGERIRRASATARLPREARASVRRGWLVGAIAVGAALVVTVVVAGLTAGPDAEGRSAALVLHVGESSASTVFPGWFYGVPVLAALALLVLIAVVGLLRATSALQTRRLLSVGGGMVAFALGSLWFGMGRAGSLGASLRDADGRMVQLTSPFAPLQMPLTAAGLVLCGIGVGLAVSAAVIRYSADGAEGRRMGRTNEE